MALLIMNGKILINCPLYPHFCAHKIHLLKFFQTHTPPCQQWSAFGLPPLPPPAADVICEWPLMPYSLMTSCSWEISSNLRYGLSSDTRVPTLGLISGPVKEVRFFDFRFLVGEDGLGLVKFPNPHYVVIGESD